MSWVTFVNQGTMLAPVEWKDSFLSKAAVLPAVTAFFNELAWLFCLLHMAT